ncbi:MAG TPA: LamG domain-containing protein [bacterium]|nr:LamG domain-containing protein [bacterium]
MKLLPAQIKKKTLAGFLLFFTVATMAGLFFTQASQKTIQFFSNSILNASLQEPQHAERPIPTPVYAAVYPWDAPYAYYDFRAPRGTTTVGNRSSAKPDQNMIMAATTGTPGGISIDGKYGASARFNGTTEYAYSTGGGDIEPEESFSVEAWIYLNSVSLTPGAIQTVMAKWDETSDQRFFRLAVRTDPNDYSTQRAFPIFQISTDGTADNIVTVTGTTQIIGGRWYLLQGYYNDVSSEISIFVNGALEAKVSSVDTVNANNTGLFTLAATKTDTDTYSHFLGGKIDEVRIYKGVRVMGAFAYSADRGKPTLHLKLNDGSGLQAVDSSPFETRHALINFANTPEQKDAIEGPANTTASPSQSPWTMGPFRTLALEFNGATDHRYIDIGYHPRLQLVESITLSAWIKPTSLGNYAIISQPHTNGYTFQMTSDGELQFGPLGGTLVKTSGANITAGVWQHVTASYNGETQLIALYKDGRLITNTALSRWAVPQGATLVGRASPTTPLSFNGIIDEVLIYPYARDMLQVAADRFVSGIVLGGTVAYQPNNLQVKTCPTGFVHVPGDPLYGTSDFCVMKYHAKCDTDGDGIGNVPPVDTVCNGSSNADGSGDYYGTYRNNGAGCACTAANGNTVVSTAQGFPIAYIPQSTPEALNDANEYCEAMGPGYHLITEAEWMTIARNIEKQASNWCVQVGSYGTYPCGNSPGVGMLASGHSDMANEFVYDTHQALPASTNDAYGCYLTRTGGTVCNGTSGEQKRTHTLSNGEVIWDLSGNLYNWTNGTIDGANKPNSGTTTDWVEWTYFNNAGDYGTLYYDLLRSTNTIWGINQEIGRYYMGSRTGGTTFGIIRGSDWNAGLSGVFNLNMLYGSGSTFLSIGFRCTVTL